VQQRLDRLTKQAGRKSVNATAPDKQLAVAALVTFKLAQSDVLRSLVSPDSQALGGTHGQDRTHGPRQQGEHGKGQRGRNGPRRNL
jgi:hypothetical protein